MRKKIFTFCLLLCSVMIVQAQKVVTVSASGGYSGLKKTVEEAIGGTTVKVQIGRYIDKENKGAIMVPAGVTVIGGYTGTFADGDRIYPGKAADKDEMTVLDGNSLMKLPGEKDRVAIVEGTLEGCMIRNGHVRGGENGGGVLIREGGLVVNCILKGNVAMNVTNNDALGGGAYLEGGTIANCVVAFNMANDGYGIAGSGEVVNNTITANTYAPEAVRIDEKTYHRYKHWFIKSNPGGLLPWDPEEGPGEPGVPNEEDDNYDDQVITVSTFHIAATLTTTSQFAVFAAAMDLSIDDDHYVTFETSPFATLKDPSYKDPSSGDVLLVADRLRFDPENFRLFQCKNYYLYGLRCVGSDFIYDMECANMPMSIVTWYGSLAYSIWLGGSLPTEGQWELAARSNGTDVLDTYMYAGSDVLEDVGVNTEFGEDEMMAVGGKQPTALGIYDMTGNLWEMCADYYTFDKYPDYTVAENYPNNTLTDPIWSNPDGGDIKRVIRGGSYYIANNLPLPYRVNHPTLEAYSNAGFRPVLVSVD